MDDGQCLFYAGRSNGMHGEPEGGKSWVAMIAMAQTLAEHDNVLFIDYEDNEAGVVERLRSLGVKDCVIDSYRFDYVHPEEPLGAGSPALGDLAVLLAAKPYALIVIDSTGEAMGMEGLDPLNNADSNTFVNRLVRRCVGTGACVLLIDHVAKGRETRGDWAIGAQHKRAMIRGASYVVENKKPFARGTDGELVLKVAKDTPGHIRGRVAHGAPAARLTIAFDPETGAADYHLDAQISPNEHLAHKIEAHLKMNPGASKRALRALGNSDAVDLVLAQMGAVGSVRVEITGTVHAHFWVQA